MVNITHNCTNTIQPSDDQAGDAVWILTSAFIIFTMQSGFGLLEAGTVSSKNETNIMVKNAIDVIFGALGYWVCGFGFSFGNVEQYANGFSGFGYFLTDSSDEKNFGNVYAKYFFQLSFATTATTIVSGAMAERTNLKAYIIFSSVNFLSYVFPAHWIWDKQGFLNQLNVIDVAGCGPVHIVGGMCALVATLMLKPRTGIFVKGSEERRMASPTNVVLGTFMLWWGWLGFNCGSTFGVSGTKWKLASRTSVTTINGSIGGGMWSVLYSYCLTKKYNGKLDVGEFTTGILAGLVSITAICAVCRPWEALLIGFIGGILASYSKIIMQYAKIDDPVTCVSVHLVCGAWGMLAVGLFCEKELSTELSQDYGVFKGGPIKVLGVQCLAILCIAAWAASTCFTQLYIINKLIPIRMNYEEEKLGADYVEHGIPSGKSSTSDHSPSHSDQHAETNTDVGISTDCLDRDSGTTNGNYDSIANGTVNGNSDSIANGTENKKYEIETL